jgi:hypothetical protein
MRTGARLGLEAIPPQSPTIDGRTEHDTMVIAGLREDDSGYSAKVYDP